METSARRRNLAGWLSSSAEPWLYALWAGACTLWVAVQFFASLRLQTHMSWLSIQPAGFERAAAGELLGEWSAPLDDVFIHFDFARATARGYPFQWSEGNGYSSGGTSLLYPFVLAFGYWVGFRKLHLMIWAGIVACVCVFGVLLAARRLYRDLPRWTSYLAPPAFLCVGALDWTLFSGMEVAFLLAMWAAAFIAWDDLVREPRGDAAPPKVGRVAAILGFWCAALVATRPEAAVVVAVFSLSAAFVVLKRRGRRSALAVLLTSAVPGALVIVAHAVVNQLLTGDSSAAGALAKLELHHPHLSKEQVWGAWKFHVGYQVLRVTHYHLSEIAGWGWILWGLALVPWFKRATRGYAALLWVSAALWILVVALNGQVRWQNERYTMPAVAWLVLASGLGVGVLLSEGYARGRRALLFRGVSIAAAVAAVSLYTWQQLPRFREQVWFFGRASRNIRDQHVLTGRLLRHLEPPPRRVLVGDAGAIPYTSDLPALDIIGLGGYRNMPFARATRWGIAAGVELIERIPKAERPDALALYPSWWGAFPLWFGEPVAEVPVRGNVICGGPTKVVYRPDWSPLDGSADPATVGPGRVVVDRLDFADVVNEDEHGYEISRRAVGFISMKLLPDPRNPRRDLWDAGRIIPPGVRESFRISGLAPNLPARLTFRTAPAQPSQVRVVVDGRPAGTLELEPADEWREVSIEIPESSVRPSVAVVLEPESGEHVFYHLWISQPK